MAGKKRTVLSVEIDSDLAAEIDLRCAQTQQSRSTVIRAALHKELQTPHIKLKAADTPYSSKRNIIFLTEPERVHFSGIAKANGFTSWQKWSIALMRESAYGELPISPANTIKIDHAVYEIAAIGKNINQIAKAINTAAMVQLFPVDLAKLRKIEAVIPTLKEAIADLVNRLAIPVRTKFGPKS